MYSQLIIIAKQTYQGLFCNNDWLRLTIHYSAYSLRLKNLMNLWAILEQDCLGLNVRTYYSCNKCGSE